MSRNECFFFRFEYHTFNFLYPFVNYLLALSRKYADLVQSEKYRFGVR
jgi:hypothetical protein